MGASLEFAEFGLRILVASLCGAAIGFERERQNKPAGLRTHMMVSLGSAGFTLVAMAMSRNATDTAPMDPLRVVDGIVGGIGFLGAGAIIQSRGSVKGITTAAGIWVVGAIGVACGVGMYQISVLITGVSLAILYPLGYYEQHIMAIAANGEIEDNSD